MGLFNVQTVCTDNEVLADACWTISHLSDGENERIDVIINAEGLLPSLVRLLAHPANNVVKPALRALGNVVTGDDRQTAAALAAGLVPKLSEMLEHSQANIRKEACWTLSNITAGTQDQINMVIEAGCLPKLVKILNEDIFDVQKEATWVLSNATSGGSSPHIHKVVEAGALGPYVNMLSNHDTRIILVALEGLQNIFRTGRDASRLGEYIAEFNNENGESMVRSLTDHSDEQIASGARTIIERYF